MRHEETEAGQLHLLLSPGSCLSVRGGHLSGHSDPAGGMETEVVKDYVI